MANRINDMVDKGSAFYDSGAVTVWGGGGSMPKSNPVDVWSPAGSRLSTAWTSSFPAWA
jgi:hypothetical protein